LLNPFEKSGNGFVAFVLAGFLFALVFGVFLFVFGFCMFLFLF